jgi:hypothetical protein
MRPSNEAEYAVVVIVGAEILDASKDTSNSVKFGVRM